VLLGARAAPGEMRTHARDGAVGVRACEPELDVAVERGEALLAGELGPGGTEHPREELAFAKATSQRQPHVLSRRDTADSLPSGPARDAEVVAHPPVDGHVAEARRPAGDVDPQRAEVAFDDA